MRIDVHPHLVGWGGAEGHARVEMSFFFLMVFIVVIEANGAGSVKHWDGNNIYHICCSILHVPTILP